MKIDEVDTFSSSVLKIIAKLSPKLFSSLLEINLKIKMKLKLNLKFASVFSQVFFQSSKWLANVCWKAMKWDEEKRDNRSKQVQFACLGHCWWSDEISWCVERTSELFSKQCLLLMNCFNKFDDYRQANMQTIAVRMPQKCWESHSLTGLAWSFAGDLLNSPMNQRCILCRKRFTGAGGFCDDCGPVERRGREICY